MVKYYIFDLDNTLYDPKIGVLDAVDERINLFIKNRIQCENVDELRKSYRDTYGTTLLGLMRHYKVKPDEYLSFVHDINYDEYLQKDEKLYETLEKLDGKKVIFTNACFRHAEQVLYRLSVINLFEKIFSIEEYIEFPKPFDNAYLKVIKELNINSSNDVVYFEDSKKNLIASKKFGFKTALVWGQGEEFDFSFKNIYEVASLKEKEVSVGY